jgi:signal transduction histidine kinase
MNPSTIADFESKLVIASEALRRAEERATAGQLAMEVIHEIRNPLQALEYLVFLTLRDAEDTEKVRGYMQGAEEQIATPSQIATGTLRLARDSPFPQPVSVSVLTEAALRIPSANHRLEGSAPRQGYTRGDCRSGVHPRNPAGRLQPDCQCAGCDTGKWNSSSPGKEERG